MNCLFLYNPNSGKGKLLKKLPYIERRLKERFGQVVCKATESAEDLEEQARKGAENYDAVVFSGGDGTFHHVLEGIGERDVTLGYLPSGTVNDAARSFGIPKSLKGALNLIVKGNAEQADCMRINGSHYAVYIAAAGAFTRVTYDTPQTEKRLLGKAAYAVEGLKHSDFEPFPITVFCDGEKTETNAALVFVLNGRFVAGFPMNKRASVKDGLLEVVVIRQAKRTNFARKIKTMCTLAHLFLFGCKVRKKDVLLLRGRRVEIEADEGVLWDFDGEKGTRGKIEIEALPRRIKLFAGKMK